MTDIQSLTMLYVSSPLAIYIKFSVFKCIKSRTIHFRVLTRKRKVNRKCLSFHNKGYSFQPLNTVKLVMKYEKAL